MIVEGITKNKNNTYTIIVNNESYIFDEEIVLEYRLVKGKEINKTILEAALKKK